MSPEVRANLDVSNRHQLLFKGIRKIFSKSYTDILGF
jgi:hypothetical protein